MTSKTPEYFCQRFGELQSARSPHETVWRDIAKFIRTARSSLISAYHGKDLPPEQDAYVTNGIGGFALDNFVGGIYGYLSNESNAWIEFQSDDDDLNKWHKVKTWNQTVSRRVLRSYGPGISPFYAQIPELYADAPAFGNSTFLSELKRDRRTFHDRCYSPFDVYLDVNQYNEIDTWYRPFFHSKRQIKQQFGDKGLPAAITNMTDDQKCQIIHVVTANDQYTEGAIGNRGFPFSDMYIAVEAKHELQKGGRYDSYQSVRWAGDGTYGYGLGMRALPDVKTANAMDRSLLEFAEWQAHPSPLMPDRSVLSTSAPRPRKPIYGGTSATGKRMIDFLSPPGNVGITHELLQQRNQQVRDSFMFGLMQMAGRSGMTTVEVIQRDEAAMRLLSPHLGRIINEFLAPSATQRFGMLWRAGWLPEPPPELKGKQMQLKFVSPMANAQKAAAAAGTLQVIDAVILLAKSGKPDTLDLLDEEEAIRVVADARSAPASILRSPEKVAALRQTREQQALQQQQLGMAQQGADIASKLAVAMPRNGGMKAA